MGVLEAVKKKMGQKMTLAGEGFKEPWRTKQFNKSPNFTMQWKNIPSIS
jgi:DNA polymerase V